MQLGDERQVSKRRAAIHHLVQDAAKRPDVGGAAELQHRAAATQSTAAAATAAAAQRRHVHDGLWRHVVEGAHLAVAHDVGGVVGDGARDAKVNELQHALHKHKVGGLQVAVHNARAVDGVHAAQHVLPPQAQDVAVDGGRTGAAAAACLRPLLLLQHGCQVQLPQLHHHVDALGGVRHLRVHQPDDVLAARQLAQQRDLVGVVGHGGGVHARQAHALHGVRLQVVAQHAIHAAAAALANALQLQVRPPAHRDGLRACQLAHKWRQRAYHLVAHRRGHGRVPPACTCGGGNANECGAGRHHRRCHWRGCWGAWLKRHHIVPVAVFLLIIVVSVTAGGSTPSRPAKCSCVVGHGRRDSGNHRSARRRGGGRWHRWARRPTWLQDDGGAVIHVIILIHPRPTAAAAATCVRRPWCMHGADEQAIVVVVVSAAAAAGRGGCNGGCPRCRRRRHWRRHRLDGAGCGSRRRTPAAAPTSTATAATKVANVVRNLKRRRLGFGGRDCGSCRCRRRATRLQHHRGAAVHAARHGGVQRVCATEGGERQCHCGGRGGLAAARPAAGSWRTQDGRRGDASHQHCCVLRVRTACHPAATRPARCRRCGRCTLIAAATAAATPTAATTSSTGATRPAGPAAATTATVLHHGAERRDEVGRRQHGSAPPPQAVHHRRRVDVQHGRAHAAGRQRWVHFGCR